jgi:PAS domain S-box-containing protein
MRNGFLDAILTPEQMARSCSEAFAHLDDAVLVIGRKPRTIVACNRATEVMFGYPAADLVGRETSLLHVDMDHFEEFGRLSEPELETSDHFRMRFRMRRRNGDLFDTLHTVVLLEPDRGVAGGALSIVRDLSDVGGAMRALEEARASLVRAQRAEAAGRVQSMMAHDLNNLLTVALGNIGLLLETELSGDQGGSAQQAYQALLRASAQIRRLLAYARPPEADSGRSDANRIIGELGDAIQAVLGSSIEYRFEPERGLPEIGVDAAELEQIVLNLVLNARQAMARGGRLVVRTQRRGSQAILSVTDTGEGIPPDLQARIFEPFFTTRGEGGTGLGLAVVRTLAEGKRGSVTVESQAGAGTTFEIRLPLAT